MRTSTNALSVVLVLVVVLSGIGPAVATTTAAPTAPAVSAGPNVAQTAAPGNCAFPMTATDATGTEVTVDSEPQRVVAAGASAAQTMWEIGAREKVVGISQYAAYLEGAETRRNVSTGELQQPVNVEEVVGLTPDLVLAANIIPNETVDTLRGAGLTVFKFESADSFGDIYAKTNLTGRLAGACDGADRIVGAMQTRVETVRQAVGNESAPNALYLQSGGFVAGNGTFIGDVIETAGTENLAATAGIGGYDRISPEVVANRSLQWIITSNRSFVPEGEPWASTTAVQQNRTVVVDGNYISQPAPRVALSLTGVARAVHPGAVQSANLSAIPIGPAALDANATTEQPVAADGGNATATGTATANATTATSDGGTPGTAGNATETTSGDGPGFGVWVAAVALLAAALLARRT